MPAFVKDEETWEKAKSLAEEQGHKEDWPYVTGIYRKMRPQDFKKKACRINTLSDASSAVGHKVVKVVPSNPELDGSYQLLLDNGRSIVFHAENSKKGSIMEIHPLSKLLACLRALHMIHWTNHWKSQGTTFYGDHLLFQRLYEGMVNEIDGLAEKLMAKFGKDAVDEVTQIKLMTQMMLKYESNQTGDLYYKALWAENYLLAIIKEIFDSLEAQNDLSLGMNDFLAALANAHETNQYLLNQRITQSKIASRVAKKYLNRK